jgi:RNA polymerase sigma-B factor
VHVPRSRKEQVLRLYQTADELHQRLGRSPTTTELADHLRLTDEELLETWVAAESQIGLSLDRPAGDDADVSMGDLVAAPLPREEPEDLLMLTGLIADLPELERQVIVLRFFQDLNQDAIAARLGCSQMHVSRLLRRALARMRLQLVEP